MLAHFDLESDIGAHGQPMREATSADADANDRGSKWFYRAGLPLVDHAEKALADAKAAYKKSNPDADTSYLVWTVEKVIRDAHS